MKRRITSSPSSQVHKGLPSNAFQERTQKEFEEFDSEKEDTSIAIKPHGSSLLQASRNIGDFYTLSESFSAVFEDLGPRNYRSTPEFDGAGTTIQYMK